MIRWCQNKYLKSRVISLSYHIDKLMNECVKQGFANPEEKFLEEDHYRFFECNYVSQLTAKFNPIKSEFNEAEWDKYQEGLKKLEQYRSLRGFMDNMKEFHWELKSLYLEVTREIATPNMWAIRENTSASWEIDAHDAFHKYNKLMKELDAFPEWQQKVRDEHGYYIHMLYNSLNHQDKFNELFANFDTQYFFK